MDQRPLRELLALLATDDFGCWLAPVELASEVRSALWEHVNGKPTRGKQPVPFCEEERCVFPGHQELTQETRARRLQPTCGNCSQIRFKGPQLISLDEGTCNVWKKSGRLAVQSCAEGCELWTRRSKIRRDRDAANKRETAIFLDRYNQGARSKRK